MPSSLSSSPAAARHAETRPVVRARVEGSSVPGPERAFAEDFTIGRGMQATVYVDSGRVSRLHAEVTFEDGAWVLRDVGSTNGTYHAGARVERLVLSGETAVRLGREGPFVYLSVESGGAPPAGQEPPRTVYFDVAQRRDSGGATEPESEQVAPATVPRRLGTDPTEARRPPAREASPARRYGLVALTVALAVALVLLAMAYLL